MSKSSVLSSKLFGDPLESFPPGDVSRKDIYRSYLWQVAGHPMVKKELQKDFKATVAKGLLTHWGIQEEPKVVYDKHLKYTKSILTKVVNRGTYLHHCGSRLDDQQFIEEEEMWFSQIVNLKKNSKEVMVEVSFELAKLFFFQIFQNCTFVDCNC